MKSLKWIIFTNLFVLISLCHGSTRSIPIQFHTFPAYPIAQFPYFSILDGGIQNDQKDQLFKMIHTLLDRWTNAKVIQPDLSKPATKSILSIENHTQAGLKKLGTMFQAQTMIKGKFEASSDRGKLLSRLFFR